MREKSLNYHNFTKTELLKQLDTTENLTSKNYKAIIVLCSMIRAIMGNKDTIKLRTNKRLVNFGFLAECLVKLFFIRKTTNTPKNIGLDIEPSIQFQPDLVVNGVEYEIKFSTPAVQASPCTSQVNNILLITPNGVYQGQKSDLITNRQGSIGTKQPLFNYDSKLTHALGIA